MTQSSCPWATFSSRRVLTFWFLRSNAIHLPIRPINFQYPEFQAVDREKYPTPDIAGWSPAPLTRVSTECGIVGVTTQARVCASLLPLFSCAPAVGAAGRRGAGVAGERRTRPWGG